MLGLWVWLLCSRYGFGVWLRLGFGVWFFDGDRLWRETLGKNTKKFFSKKNNERNLKKKKTERHLISLFCYDVFGYKENTRKTKKMTRK